MRGLETKSWIYTPTTEKQNPSKACFSASLRLAMLALALKISLLGVTLLVLLSALVLTLSACGSSKNTQSATKSAETIGSKAEAQKQKAEGQEHPIDVIPPPVNSADENKTVVRVGVVNISGAEYAHLAKVLTPKIASYEPRSRMECSSKKASASVQALSAKPGADDDALPSGVAKLSPQKLQALCVRLRRKSVKEEALQQLISYQWVLGEAKELGVAPSEAQVQKALAQELSDKQTAKELKRVYAATGQSVNDTRSALRLQLATQNIFAIIKRKVSERFTKAAIERWYRDHLKEVSLPETRDIRGIRTWTRQAISKAIAEVRAGKDIGGVAERVSIDKPSGEDGGLIKEISKGQQEKGLDEAIFAAKPHVLTGPLHLRGRYWAFEVVKVTPAKTKSLREVEPAVRQKLLEELLANERARFVRAFREKWLGRTSCVFDYRVSRCREWRGPSVLDTEDPYEVK